MTQTAIPQAQRLTEVFDHFNQASGRLSASWRLLAAHIRALDSSSTASGAGDHGDADPQGSGDDAAARQILDALPAGVVQIDGEGRLAVCNPAAAALLGKPRIGELWREVIERAFAPANGVDGLLLASGRVVSVATAPLGRGPGQIVLLKDVTETRVVQAMVQRQQRLSSLGEMVAALSHQLRTPLASSLLYLSQLEREDLTSEAKGRCISKLRACLDHLGNLSRDMLAFAGGGSLYSGDFAISDLLDDFRKLSVALLDDSRCHLEIVDDCAGVNVRGNRDAVLTVLQNLVENAIQACNSSGRDGNLRLLIRRAGEQDGIACVELLLTDDGPGIPAELKSRVMEPFFSTKSSGTGLGLAVARAVAQAHGGVIWIESEPGVGTTVGLRIPSVAAIEPGRRAVPDMKKAS